MKLPKPSLQDLLAHCVEDRHKSNIRQLIQDQIPDQWIRQLVLDLQIDPTINSGKEAKKLQRKNQERQNAWIARAILLAIIIDILISMILTHYFPYEYMNYIGSCVTYAYLTPMLCVVCLIALGLFINGMHYVIYGRSIDD